MEKTQLFSRCTVFVLARTLTVFIHNKVSRTWVANPFHKWQKVIVSESLKKSMWAISNVLALASLGLE
jgi:hypothetical protein